jgi:hypothetical protein
MKKSEQGKSFHDAQVAFNLSKKCIIIWHRIETEASVDGDDYAMIQHRVDASAVDEEEGVP